VKQGNLSSGLRKRNLTCLVCLLVSGFIWNAPSQAALLNFVPPTNPDLYSANLTASLTVSFNASSGLFTVSGGTSAYTPADTSLNNGDPYTVSNDGGFDPGTFSLTATISTNGTLLGGTMEITGGLYDDSYNQIAPDGTVLLQGNLTAFGYAGYNDMPDQFDFEVALTSGALMADYGGEAYILLHPGDTSFDNDFTVSFSNDGLGDADTKSIPEPGSGLLVAVSLLGLCEVARRRRK